jgi:peptide/nickel transport system substrate-binding protein
MSWKVGVRNIALFAVLSLVLGVCASQAADEPKRGGILRYAFAGDPENWTPHNVLGCPNQVVMAQIWSALLRYNGKGEMVGDLAESWKWVDNKTLLFRLRKGVKWHNGDALTAEQVVQSEKHRLDPRESVDAKFLMENIEKWEVVDNETVKLTLKRPNVTILRWLTAVPGRAFVLHPKWDPKTAGRSAEATIGTGPFKYKAYEPGAKVQLVRNPDYFIKGMPYMDGIEFAIIRDPEAKMTGVRSGQVDMFEDIDNTAAPVLRKEPNIYIAEGKGFYGARLLLDLNLPPTNDVRVRRALNYAVNRQMIVEAALGGEGTPLWGGIIPPGRFGYAKELEGYYSYDPKKAKALLAEAGWKETKGDGKLYNQSGQPLKITYLTYGPDWWSRVAELVQANLTEIGVTVDLDVKPWAEFRPLRQKSTDLPEGAPGVANIIGATLWGLDLSDFPVYVLPGGYNFNRYNNPKVRELLRQALVTIDDTKREDLLRQLQVVMMQDAPEINPAWINRNEIVRSRVKNFSHLNQDGCFGTLINESYLDPK